ncbi:MAG: ATP-binding protein involved in chromosome partitioning [Candidatus Azotimanducaceae bacterium]|jgi:ATP-binding protein involved in chromosome partitioning|tara:strand:- start:21616 stop:22629 length:1014 start_codon:yes stop_codon:yes gene_type:complete
MKVEDFVDPYLGQTWQSLGARVLSSGKRISVTLGYPALGMQARLTEQLSAFLGVDDIELDLSFSSPPGRGFGQVKNVVLVSSGKGGVGKSTTAVNLALALDAEGAKVGLLDADIYGPSQGMMLGVAEGRRPDIKDGKFFDPIRAHGIKAMSMSFMITDKTPMVWRGPMASGALQQILGQTLWGDLDYLIVDMPPGTGDIQLTLSQKAPVAGAVIVTTPQDIALLDALKGIEMFAKVDIPVLGILENMSVHQCDNCGHISHLFGEDGGKRVAEDLGVPLLGQLPLAMSIRQQADGGNPTVKAEPESAISELYRDAARNMAARLWGKQSATPTISMVDD